MVGGRNNEQHGPPLALIVESPAPVKHTRSLSFHKTRESPSEYATFCECGTICQTPASAKLHARTPLRSAQKIVLQWLTNASRPLILAHPAYSDRLLFSRNLAQLAMLNSR